MIQRQAVGSQALRESAPADMAVCSMKLASQLKTDWVEVLKGFAQQLDPLHKEIFAKYPNEYYWTCYQSEWATDLGVSRRREAETADARPAYIPGGAVLRAAETIINNVTVFQTFRPKEDGSAEDLQLRPMRKGVAVLHRRAEVLPTHQRADVGGTRQRRRQPAFGGFAERHSVARDLERDVECVACNRWATTNGCCRRSTREAFSSTGFATAICS